jgi:hypothetical protein
VDREGLALEDRNVDRLLFGNGQVIGEQDFGGVGLRVDVYEEGLLAFASKTSSKGDAG